MTGKDFFFPNRVYDRVVAMKDIIEASCVVIGIRGKGDGGACGEG